MRGTAGILFRVLHSSPCVFQELCQGLCVIFLVFRVRMEVSICIYSHASLLKDFGCNPCMCIPCGLVLWFACLSGRTTIRPLLVFLLWDTHDGAPPLNYFLYCHFFNTENSGFRRPSRTKLRCKVLKLACHHANGYQSCLPVKELWFRKLVVLEDLIKLMDLLRNQVNLHEVVMAKEVSMDCIFVMTSFYRVVF